MQIIFVMGPACSGKSTYIKNNYPNFEVVDLYDFQENCVDIESCWQSYYDCRDKLVEIIKSGKDVVLEHTLLRAKRRVFYIDAVREITDEPIDIVLIKPDIDTLRERTKERKCFYGDQQLLDALSVLEVPTIQEGFNSVTIIND